MRYSGMRYPDYLLQILSEAGKKDKIFSERSLIKGQENLTNTMGPLGCLCANLDHLDHLDNESGIDLNILLELVEQYVVYFALLLFGMNLRLLRLKEFHQKSRYLLKL